MLRSVLANFSAFGAAHIADRLIFFVFVIYAARRLGPDMFGLYMLLGAYVMFFSVAFSAGLMAVAVREIVRGRDDPRNVFEQVLSLRLVLGSVAYVALLLVVASALPAVVLPLAAIAGSSLIVDSFRDSYAAYHTAHERMIIPGAFQVANSVLLAVSGTILLYAGFGVMSLLIAGAVVNLLVTAVWHAVFTVRFQPYRIRLEVRAWRQMLTRVAPIVPLQLAIQSNRLASMIMLSLVGGPIAPDRAAGYFGTAQQIANFPLGFMLGLRRAIVPPVAGMIRRGEPLDQTFSIALKAGIVFISFPLLIITLLLSREVLLVLFGPEYLESTLTLQLLGAASALWMAAIIPESFLISVPEERFSRFFAGAFVPLLINVALCLILIPTYSMVGAAVAILLARGVHLLFSLYYCGALLPINSLGIGRLVRPLAALCAAFAGAALAAEVIDHTGLRSIAVVVLAAAGMFWAGYPELRGLWAKVLRRSGSTTT